MMLIAAGAGVMTICVKRSGPAVRQLKSVSKKDYLKIRLLGRLHRALMAFFVVGYITVAVSIAADIAIIGELLIGGIFFFGALFVLMGILIQSRMTAALKLHYDEAVAANQALRTEQDNLFRANRKLSDEIAERIEAETALTRSQTFLQTVVDALPEQLMVINPNYTVALANRTALAINRLASLPEGTHCHKISHKSDAPCSGSEHPCPLKTVLQSGRQTTMEHEHTDAEGNPTVVEIVATPIFDDAGTVCQVIESSRDITLRRHAEERIRLSEERYRTILETIEEGYFEISLAGDFTFVNAAMSRILGYERERLIGMNNRDYASPEVAAAMYRHFKAIYNGGAPSPIATFEIIPHDQKLRVMELTAALLRDSDGTPSGFRGLARDVTELAIAQKALEESEERYRNLADLTLEGICLNDKSVIIDVNEAFARMFGYRSDELVGMDAVEHLIAPESRASVVRTVGNESSEVYEAIGVRKDGSRFPIEIEGRMVRYKGKRVRVASLRDVTERKRAEQRLAMLHKMQAIGTLASGIAHDFNNILSAIMGNTEMCLLEVNREHKMTSRLDNILRASHRARELVAQILNFSRSEEVDARPIRIGPIIKETFKLLRSSIPTTIDMVADIEQDTGQVRADATHIHQILMNLCTNAAHAMRADGGTLTIALANVEIDTGFGTGMAQVMPGSYVRLQVSDTGHGMAPETVNRIFEPYFTTKPKDEGTGLGLFMVQGIVQQHNGWMDVTSRPGEGSTFSIFFPKITQQQGATPTVAAQSLPTGTETILIVDDDEHLVEMTSEMLGGLGYRVIPAKPPQQALQMFTEIPNRFDLVFTDQTMPGMTGAKLIRLLREHRPDLPAIVCTGFSESMDAETARDACIDGFLMKPMEMSDLARLIRRVIDNRRSSTR